jgi:hypothetical protein
MFGKTLRERMKEEKEKERGRKRKDVGERKNARRG